MQERAYQNFDLLIESGESGSYRARVLSSPVGETRPITVTIPFSDLEIENFLLKVGRPRRQAVRGENSPEVATVRTFGGRLFDAVFRDQVRNALARSLDQIEGQEDTGLRVRLRLADCPELADLPWEYLYYSDKKRYLALSQWTPVVRYLELPGRIRPLAVQPPLRILVMAASPTDFPPLDVAAEWAKTQGALADLQRAGRVQVDRVPAGTLADLRRHLRRSQYHVFHYIGHGRYDLEAQDGVLALEGPDGRGQPVSGGDLGALLYDHRSLRLALLNSCEGARGGLADPYSGTAQSLIYQGIPAVVAMQFEITDQSAITFAHTLYEAVADGYPLDAAVAEARNAIRDEPNPIEWATPVLYLRAPDGRIFDLPPSAHTAHQMAGPEPHTLTTSNGSRVELEGRHVDAQPVPDDETGVEPRETSVTSAEPVAEASAPVSNADNLQTDRGDSATESPPGSGKPDTEPFSPATNSPKHPGIAVKLPDFDAPISSQSVPRHQAEAPKLDSLSALVKDERAPSRSSNSALGVESSQSKKGDVQAGPGTPKRRMVLAILAAVATGLVSLTIVWISSRPSSDFNELVSYLPAYVRQSCEELPASRPGELASADCAGRYYDLWESPTKARESLGEAPSGDCSTPPSPDSSLQQRYTVTDDMTATIHCSHDGPWYGIRWVIDGLPITYFHSFGTTPSDYSLLWDWSTSDLEEMSGNR
ncbi:CHAT domain-containing protein [Blastococcus mobilis]|uniref:CHAT domain-containing protein n=1 Tax=Blastococcus mobilis TaxID=1938746 RepID=A0A239AIZ9_9ACTN|nr:CHAT domain-containing protein [Blastococcus mobilis]SNR94903.1 CHAT domain-containing protein [Blastococcus mobilis]